MSSLQTEKHVLQSPVPLQANDLLHRTGFSEYTRATTTQVNCSGSNSTSPGYQQKPTTMQDIIFLDSVFSNFYNPLSQISQTQWSEAHTEHAFLNQQHSAKKDYLPKAFAKSDLELLLTNQKFLFIRAAVQRNITVASVTLPNIVQLRNQSNAPSFTLLRTLPVHMCPSSSISTNNPSSTCIL